MPDDVFSFGDHEFMRNFVLAGLAGLLVMPLAMGPLKAADYGDNGATNGESYPMYTSWSGFFVGVHGGYSAFDLDGNLSGGGAYSRNKNKFNYGFYGGYNYQYNRMVFGVDGDFTFSRAGDITQFLTGGEALRHRPGHSARGRLRFGFLVEETFMPYIAGGFATRLLELEHLDDNGATTSTDEEWVSGFTIGAGLAHAFTPNFISRIEFVWDDYGKKDLSYNVGANQARASLKTRSKTWRLGLAYKF